MTILQQSLKERRIWVGQCLLAEGTLANADRENFNMFLNFQIILQTADVKCAAALGVVAVHDGTSIVLAAIGEADWAVDCVLVGRWKVWNLENVENSIVDCVVVVLVKLPVAIEDFFHLLDCIGFTVKCHRDFTDVEWRLEFDLDEDFIAELYESPVSFGGDNGWFADAADLIEHFHWRVEWFEIVEMLQIEANDADEIVGRVYWQKLEIDGKLMIDDFPAGFVSLDLKCMWWVVGDVLDDELGEVWRIYWDFNVRKFTGGWEVEI